MPHESISVKDIFKIGIGPSSSHTLGPWRAAQRFTDSIRARNGLTGLQQVSVLLYGSLAKTGKGHGTDIAIQLGLAGEDPVTFDTGLIDTTIQDDPADAETGRSAGSKPFAFDPDTDIRFLSSETLPYHPNAMTFLASWKDGREIGGDLVFHRRRLCQKGRGRNGSDCIGPVAFPDQYGFGSAALVPKDGAGDQ